jgi:outer membrane cobalamin receptor
VLKFLIAIAATATLAACAQTPSSEQIVSSEYLQHDDCLKTGTRIRLSNEECVTAVSGRVYTQKEIEQTGAFTISEALRRLDPTL